MEISRQAEPDREFCLEMEYDAVEPYLRFVYADPDQARFVLRFLYDKGLSEVAPRYVRMLIRGGRPLAMLACCPAVELRQLRLRAALALSRLDLLRADPAIGRRIQLAARTLIRLEEGDYYVGRLGVVRKLRAAGLGVWMMQSCVDEARELGFRRLTGEVHPSATAMLRLCCERIGFEQVDLRRVEDPESGRELEYVHIVKQLS
jgi:GNAT superfamily N-acetyltransferase